MIDSRASERLATAAEHHAAQMKRYQAALELKAARKAESARLAAHRLISLHTKAAALAMVMASTKDSALWSKCTFEAAGIDRAMDTLVTMYDDSDAFHAVLDAAGGIYY